MKRLVLFSLVVGAAAVAQVVHSARGSGTIEFASNREHISFSAVERADGTATGSAEVHDISAGVTVHIDVNCLNVLGNTVATKLDLTKAFYPFGQQPQPGSAFYFSSEEVFSKPGAAVDVAVVEQNTRRPACGRRLADGFRIRGCSPAPRPYQEGQ